ncbi:vWA domain-containing protein [Novipirellula sp. SH528]|uniref:vWA domain-containing protein n=1 Tax=Novipirellula sp. SH528 TaxID=3454466 RepID=UPI003FA08593
MTIPTPPSNSQAGNSLTGGLQSNLESVDAWDEEELEEESFFSASETTAFAGSMLVHLIIILSLALVPLVMPVDEEAVVLVSPRAEEEIEKVEMIDDVTYSDLPQTEVGANSTADAAMAEASAEMFAEISEIPNPVDLEPTDFGQIMVNKMFTEAVAPLDRLKNQKGQVGQGTQGAAGAVDRITFEILQSLEERPTLVVWLFDQSGSLHRQRQEIRDRFQRIYSELGIAKESEAAGFRRNTNDSPLLSSVVGFGKTVTLFTEEPIEDLEEIKSIVQNIPVDTSGEERVFSAISSAADQYKSLRRSRGGNGPQRNVLFVVVTDERGDDANMLEQSIAACRKWAIPVYVIGVPAPFGREHTLVKYVDPDPKYDQSPQWAQVDQGPETFYPEQVQVGFTADFKQEPVIDSGFGPYALTRLCYETGGIYFTVHPNRNVSRRVRSSEIDAYSADIEYFFDPNAMARYRPDYLAPQDYVTKVKASPLRQSLVQAAQMRPAQGLSRPQTRFVKRSDAQLVGDLTKAQQDAAKLEPTLIQMATILEPGMKARDSEESLRWKAGFDLAMGRVLAQKVRTETYNAMLAKGKRGMPFEKEKNNTWILEASEEISVGSKWEREAALAKELLEGVSRDHKGTPWALLADQELTVPIGWKWTETFTDLTPRKAGGGGGGNNNNVPKDDEKRMLKKAPSRPIPKL